MGDRLCKKNDIDLDIPETTGNVFTALKRDALNFCCDDNSQMKKLWKQVQEPGRRQDERQTQDQA